MEQKIATEADYKKLTPFTAMRKSLTEATFKEKEL
jgi:hypothetical protein